MVWQVDCGNSLCLQPSWARNIVELVDSFCDLDGMMICPHCKRPSGYIRKSFKLQEEGETWEPILRGVVRLGGVGDTYQPFVFLASYESQGEGKPPQSIVEWPITDLWFSYYKDLRGHIREDGTPGRLKMGYGPGGPPVIGIPQFLELLRHVVRLGMTNHSDIAAVLPPPSSGGP